MTVVNLNVHLLLVYLCYRLVQRRSGLHLPAATVDSVEENLEASRCFLLLYGATTFCGKTRPSSTYSNNNNNIVMESPLGEPGGGGGGGPDGGCFDGTEEFCPDPRQRLEVVFATHRALLEGTLKVPSLSQPARGSAPAVSSSGLIQEVAQEVTRPMCRHKVSSQNVPGCTNWSTSSGGFLSAGGGGCVATAAIQAP